MIFPEREGEGDVPARRERERDDGGLSAGRGGGERNGKPFPSSPYLEEGHVRGSAGETLPKKRQCFARKLLPRDAVHINPRLAYCFPDQEEIYVRSLPVRGPSWPDVGDEVWKEARSRAFTLALSFVLSSLPAKRPMRLLHRSELHCAVIVKRGMRRENAFQLHRANGPGERP